jgi:hypothetical protein
VIPEREKDNGIRLMVFADNRRMFLSDFIIECAPGIDHCEKSAVLPVEHPPEVARGEHISQRWSEIIVAPDETLGMFMTPGFSTASIHSPLVSSGIVPTPGAADPHRVGLLCGIGSARLPAGVSR